MQSALPIPKISNYSHCSYLSFLVDYSARYSKSEINSVAEFCFDKRYSLGNEKIHADWLLLFNFATYQYLFQPLSFKVFSDVLNNLKLYVTLNEVYYSIYFQNKKIPMFYIETIEKSFDYFQKSIIDRNFYNNESIFDILQDLLLFSSILVDKISSLANVSTHGVSLDSLRHCVHEIATFFHLLKMKIEYYYDFPKRGILQFYLNRLYPKLDPYVTSGGEIEEISNISQGCGEEKNSPVIQAVHIVLCPMTKDGERPGLVGNGSADELLTTARHADLFTHKFIISDPKQVVEKMWIMINDYYTKKKLFMAQQAEAVSFNKLAEYFKNKHKNFRLELIGSVSLKLNIPFDDYDPHVDLLLIHENQEGLNELKQMNLQEIYERFSKDLNSHKFASPNFPDIHSDYLFFHIPSEKENNVNLYICKEKYSFCNMQLKEIFSLENISMLHVFYQEIIIRHLEIVSNGSELCFFILKFLEFKYNIFFTSDTENLMSFQSLQYMEKECSKKSHETCKLKLSCKEYNRFKINQEKLAEVGMISVVELTFDFYLFLKNFLIFSTDPSCPKQIKDVFKDKYQDPKDMMNLQPIYNEFLKKNNLLKNQQLLNAVNQLYEIFLDSGSYEEVIEKIKKISKKLKD